MLAVIATLFTAVSCLEKDNLNESNIYGKWMATEWSLHEYVNEKLTESTTHYAESDYNIYYQFTNDGKGQYVEIEEGYPYVKEIKSWVLLDDSLVIAYEDGDTETFKITYLNRSDLQMSEIDEYTEDGQKFKDIYSITLKKI